MITYSVAQVESLSGISAHSLRIWERRYDFIKPHRTETNIRFYSDDQLKKLINVGILLKNSYKISKVAAMTDDEIHSIVSKLLLHTTNTNQEDIKALSIAMIDMEEQAFNQIFESQVIKNGLVPTFLNLIYPFLQHVGVLWGINKTMPAQEHFISNLIRQKLIAATDQLPLPKSDAPCLLLYLFEGEDHEIGLLLANYMAKELGWRTCYLGSNVPFGNIKIVNEQIKPDLMFSIFTSPRNAKFVKNLAEFLKEIDNTLFYSGHSDLVKQTEFDNKTVFLQSPAEFSKYLASK